jgi:ArsR family metal-binding transcriptional regulator
MRAELVFFLGRSKKKFIAIRAGTCSRCGEQSKGLVCWTLAIKNISQMNKLNQKKKHHDLKTNHSNILKSLS